jgi:amino acid adenylation domain-containing protein
VPEPRRNNDALTPEQRNPLDQRLERQPDGRALPRIPLRSRNAVPVPLSFGQQRLFFLHQLDPQGWMYNICGALLLEGQLERDALRRALTEIIRRHEILRTVFAGEGENAVQVIQPAQPVALNFVDFSPAVDTDDLLEIRRLVASEARRPFDLSRGPLLRCTLARLGAERHALILAVHHIVFDGWSVSVFARELAVLYDAFSRSRPSPLPELPIQHADFAAWQQVWMSGKVLDRHLAYWQSNLKGAPSMLHVPLDHPRSRDRSGRAGAHETLRFRSVLSTSIQALSRRTRVTPFMTLLAAFNVLLLHYTGQEDIVIGTVVANRTRTELEKQIGFFVNGLPLRTDLSGKPTFRELLPRVRDVVLGAFAHQELPFEKIVEDLHPERALERHPIFQVVFTVKNVAAAPPQLSELKVTPLSFDDGPPKFDLSLSVATAATEMSASLGYSRDLFDPPTITRMLEHFERILEQVTADPDCALKKIELITPQERRMITGSNATTTQSTNRCIHQLFEDQVVRTPNATAVVAGNRRLSYAELNERANRLARHLAILGVGPEARVAVCLRRSDEIVVALLGILKAGGAYVPLDPSYPADRLRFMLFDSRPVAVLTERHVQHSLPACNAKVVCLEDDASDLRVSSDATSDNLESGVTQGNLAYVIYTSGSIGRPKGVMIEHRSATAFVSWAHQVFTPQQLQGTLFATSICFDLSVYEIFVPLSVGGKVILAENALQLPKLPAANEVTLINTVPSSIAELLSMGGMPHSVKTVNLAGEPLASTLVDQIYAKGIVKQVFNLYGPTEATTYSTFMPAEKGVPVAIGRPIANTQLYVLNGDLAFQPIGVAGEVYIGGAGLARGYLDRPDLTAERFIPDPFRGKGGLRLYRTGDLARYRSDGNLEFLGRADQQVKIRGFRIELEEIEAVLREHPAIRHAVVAAREGATGEKELVAFVSPSSPSATLSCAAVRQFLHNKLPTHMVPALIVSVPALPLTPNGKVDRKALPIPQSIEAGRDIVAPRSDIERDLVQIWEALLGRRSISVTDRFFDVGGHSLMAERLLARVNTRWQKSVLLSVFLQEPTIERLAVLLGESASRPWNPLLPIQSTGSQTPLFCVHSLGGEASIFRALARYLGSDQPVYGLQAPHPSDIGDQYVSIEAMASQYVSAIRTIQWMGPYFLAGYSFGSTVAFEMAQQLKRRGEQLALLALLDGGSPLLLKHVPERSDAVTLAGLARDLARASGVEFALPHAKIRSMEPAAAFDYVFDAMRTANLLSSDMSVNRMSRFLQGLKTRTRALKYYVPSTYPGRITFFRSTEIEHESAEAWAELGVNITEPTKGWNQLSSEPVDLHYIPGYHATLMAEPNVRFLAKRLKSCIETAPHQRQNYWTRGVGV